THSDAKDGLRVGNNKADKILGLRLRYGTLAVHWLLGRHKTFPYARSNRYSSMTAATDFLPSSGAQRTTRPSPLTITSAGAPMTFAGIEIVNSMLEPTVMSASMLNRTPPAEISCVSALKSDAPARIAIGSLTGNRTALRISVICPFSSTRRIE